jgi:hypothetical protein
MKKHNNIQQHHFNMPAYSSDFYNISDPKNTRHILMLFPASQHGMWLQLPRIRTWREDFVAPSNMGMIRGWQFAHFQPRFFPAKNMKQHGEHMGKTMF